MKISAWVWAVVRAISPRSKMGDYMDAKSHSRTRYRVGKVGPSGIGRAEDERRSPVESGGSDGYNKAFYEATGEVVLKPLLRDISYSLRNLCRHPAVTAIAILSIGLGIGANVTIFSMASRFLLRPAPVGDPRTLLAVYPAHGVGSLSWPFYNDLREQAKSLSGVAGYFPLVPASFAGNGEPERVWGQAVTTNFFDVTELGMVRGRGFESHEDQDPVVVVSAGLWQRRFHRDPELVGKTVTISGRAFTVVGIAPIAFHSVDQLFYAEFWVPIGNAAKMVPGFPDRSDRNAAYMWLVGRQRSGVTRADALAELNALAKRLALSYPTSGKDDAFIVEQAGILPKDTRRPVFIFLTALGIVVLLVLSIAACNVANLMFVQAIGRQREMAVRLALGATRGCLRRQMLVESVLLGLGGGIAGILLSLWSMQALSTFHLPTAFPLDMRIGIDWRVVFATFILCILSGLLLGAAPAWAATRPQLMNALKGEDALARPARRLTLRKLLTVAQIAMSVILLSMTGLFLRSLQSASHIDIGFRSHGLLMMSFDPQVHGYTPQRTVAFLDLLSERVGALPAVVSTTCTDNAPLSMVGNRSSFHVIGVQDVGKSKVNAGTYMVMPDYFETMGIPRLAGRDFGSEDVTGSKTAIINETFAKRLVGWGNPIGLQISDGKGVYEIIGVTGNAKLDSLGEDDEPVLYSSLEKNIGAEPSFMGYTLLVRTSGNPNIVREVVRRQIHSLDSSMAIFNDETMDEHLRDAYFLPRLAATLFGAFGAIGLVLAAVGLYGVMAYSVSRRTREIGIRMAMGACPSMVVRLVLGQGLVLTLIGVALGWPAAWVLSKLSASFLYGIQPHDPITFVIVPPFLIAVGLAACWIPAQRAALVDPMQAMKTE